MSKAIVFTRADDGGTTVLRPVPWARLVKAFRSHSGERTEVDPPQALDRFLRRVVTKEEFATFDLDYAESEELFLARIAVKDVPKDATNIMIVDDSAVPADRTFRDAWLSDLSVDMDKAREIHKNRLRQLRAPNLIALDVEYQRADERGDARSKREIAARKQALRDVTAHPSIAAAKTPDELKVAALDVITP